MEARILRLDQLAAWITALLQDYPVIAPRDETGYGPVSSFDQIWLQEAKPARSPKEFFFARRETLLRYDLSGSEVEMVEPTIPMAEQILFGVRPCDAAALPILDRLFEWDDRDEFYCRRRQATTIVALACHEPAETCFCPSLGGSPAGTEGADLLLTRLRGVYHVHVLSERGCKLVDRYSSFFLQGELATNRERAAVEDELLARVGSTVDVSDLPERLDFTSPIWERLTEACIDCGICTFLCPTCHCFDIQDEGNPDRGERVRLWDSCAFVEYTRTHAGQPRPAHDQRYRQRIMHKFQYYPQNLGRMLCVGCGRCIRYCPAGVDLRRVLEMVRE